MIKLSSFFYWKNLAKNPNSTFKYENECDFGGFQLS
jgi:hypothetical protein